jgi:hypothetical protein
MMERMISEESLVEQADKNKKGRLEMYPHALDKTPSCGYYIFQ